MTDTKSKSFIAYTKSGKRLTQKEKAFLFMLHNNVAVTSRSLASSINIERANCTRIISDLIAE